MDKVRTKLAEGGRIVIPAEFRQKLGLKTGDELLVFLDDGQLKIMTPARALKRAQELVRRYIPPGVSLADELIRERRAEAAREEEELHKGHRDPVRP